MFVIEQPLPTAHAADSEAQVLGQWNTVYDAYNEVACLILGSMTPEIHRQFENSSPYDMIRELKSMFEKQAGVEWFDRIQTFHACKQEEDISVGLILNGLISDFVSSVRNYNIHNMRKTIGELHALLIEYEKGLPKKAATPQVMAIQGGRIQKANKKSLNAKGKGKEKGKGKYKPVYISKPKNPKPSAKEHPTKDDACHHFSKNNVLYFNVNSSNGIYEIDMINHVPNVNSIYTVSNKRARHKLDYTYLWHCRLAHISKKHIKKLQHDGILKSTDEESFDKCVSCLSGKMTRKPFPHCTKRAIDLLGIIHTDVCGQLRYVSRQGDSYFITFTDDYSRYGYVYLLKHKYEIFETFNLTPLHTPRHNEVSEKRNHTLLDMVRSMMNLTTLPLSFWDYALETATTFLIWFQPRRLIRHHMNYEKNLLSHEISGRAEELKEIQDEDTSHFKNTSKITIEVEGFEPPQEEVVPVRRAIRILIAITAFYDYEIWKMNVKTSFLNAYLDEDIYMVQPEGFIDPKHPRKVCKLQRYIYGLKQASRSWNKRFDEEIKRFGFAQKLDEPFVYQ
uniref:Retrotransposon protein, putative, Ty1-copia subclass n=1 Tax=Tanacetum cinerariifolium TaxID=118510 RepID=A0A6L2MUD5_TANCI|nr:retrotransposon protein, putative, Ty1-copia subclass [Tanacetum cinerariifolium]